MTDKAKKEFMDWWQAYPLGQFEDIRADHVEDAWLSAEEKYKPKPCMWSSEDEYLKVWETQCGEVRTMNGTPDENSMSFCPCCGGPITTGTQPAGGEE